MNVTLNWVGFQLSQIKCIICNIRKKNISRIFFFRGKNRRIHWRQTHLYYRVFLFYRKKWENTLEMILLARYKTPKLYLN